MPEAAGEVLIPRWATHLDSHIAHMRESRVRRVPRVMVALIRVELMRSDRLVADAAYVETLDLLDRGRLRS